MTNNTQASSVKKQEVQEFLKKTKNVHERERARAIVKLIEGKSRTMIAEFFDVSLVTLDEWYRRFKHDGIDGLRMKQQPGNHHVLTKEQKEEIKDVLFVKRKKPIEVGLEGGVWDVRKLRQYIKLQFQVVYKANTSYQRLFNFCGFRHRKPGKGNRNLNKPTSKSFETTLKRTDVSREKAIWYR